MQVLFKNSTLKDPLYQAYQNKKNSIISLQELKIGTHQLKNNPPFFQNPSSRNSLFRNHPCSEVAPKRTFLTTEPIMNSNLQSGPNGA